MSGSIIKRQHAVKSSIAQAEAERSPAANTLSWLVVQVMQLNGLLIAAGDALAAPAGQTSSRWQVLAAVEGAPLSVAQIARAMNLTRQSVQRVADLLVEGGLCAYEDNPAHARAKLLRLTSRGSKALQTIQAGQKVWANALAAGMDETQLRTASAVLAQLQQVLRAQEAPQKTPKE
ncbi:MarR family winged helix-turn-helix transcriptional regulator [Polaromonas sp. LjRoot131]|uniref:MarR family winged helix-turn-helix transcriptional regulator n=1 Tax=Polaromonas sp. LjRoot131 TaxID=3342262 RepID=UPI003ECE5AC6